MGGCKVAIPVLSAGPTEELKARLREDRLPVVIRGADLGPCTRTWSADYLIDHLRPRPVRVHVGTQPNLDFRSKNFTYCDMDVRELVKRAASKTNVQHFISENEIYYLRKGSCSQA